VTVRTAAEFQIRTGASAGRMDDLDRFRGMLTETNAVMNLVGPDTLPDFWSRHAWDSAQLVDIEPAAKTWADLGAGAGFPGVILAILLKDDPDAHIWLIDSLGKRCRFLLTVVETLELPATVIHGRAEEQVLDVDVVTARALAPMERLLGYAQPYMERGAQAVFLKGERAEEELREARKSWQFTHELVPSQSDPRGRLVRIGSLRRVRSA
jgi:16S rRNA (guanine527-N7)-methyltransferase